MTDIKIIKADVDKSAAAIEAAADHVAGIDIAGSIGAIPKAVPASKSAAAAKQAATSLERHRDAWVKEAHAHHKQTRADVATIQKTDEAIAAAGDKYYGIDREHGRPGRLADRLGDF